MVARTDGPFEYWEVTGDAVRAGVEKPGSDAAVIQSLAGELEGDETRAAHAIEGGVISNQDFVAAAPELNVTQAKIDAWFSDGLSDPGKDLPESRSPELDRHSQREAF